MKKLLRERFETLKDWKFKEVKCKEGHWEVVRLKKEGVVTCKEVRVLLAPAGGGRGKWEHPYKEAQRHVYSTCV